MYSVVFVEQQNSKETSRLWSLNTGTREMCCIIEKLQVDFLSISLNIGLRLGTKCFILLSCYTFLLNVNSQVSSKYAVPLFRQLLTSLLDTTGSATRRRESCLHICYTMLLQTLYDRLGNFSAT